MTNRAKSTSPRAPQSLRWQIAVATTAMTFFSLQGHDEGLRALGRVEPGNEFTAFNGSDFLRYLDHLDFHDTWPKAARVAEVLDSLVRNGLLTRFPDRSVVPVRVRPHV